MTTPRNLADSVCHAFGHPVRSLPRGTLCCCSRSSGSLDLLGLWNGSPTQGVALGFRVLRLRRTDSHLQRGHTIFVTNRRGPKGAKPESPGQRPGYGAATPHLRIGESITVVIGGHPERSEGSGLDESRSFVALRMTVIDSPILRRPLSVLFPLNRPPISHATPVGLPHG